MQNSDCHVLSHKGFDIGNEEFFLANGKTSDTIGFPQIALWDSKAGMVSVKGDSIRIKDFLEPFYYKERYSSGFDISNISKKNKYHLVNAIIQDDVRNGLVFRIDNKEYCAFLIEEDNDKYNYIIKFFGDSIVSDTSKYHKKLKIGYPVMDIIAQMPSVNINEQLERIFADSYLAKEVLNDTNSKLLFMPGESFYEIPDVSVNGKTYSLKCDVILHDVDGCSFYSGVGKKATDEYTVEVLKDSTSSKTRLLYLVPHMKNLCRIDGRVFIVSALVDVDFKMKNGGYLFNIFEYGDNFNHIKANFRYAAGAASDSLNFEVMDLFADNDCRYSVVANQEFNLNTRNKNDNISWIFEMTDLRDANPLKFIDLFWLLISFVFLVGVRLLLDGLGDSSRKNLSVFELSLYVVLLSLACVRFVLCWRVSTFIPIENISPAIYETMKNGKFGVTYMILAVPFILIVMSFDWKSIIGKRIFVWLIIPLVLFCAAVIIAVILLSGSIELTRARNIVVPILLYFILDLLLIRLLNCKNEKECNILRFSVWAIAFVYLICADAGFAEIFLFYSWLHFLVVDLCYGYRLGKPGTLKYKWFPYILSLLSIVGLFFVLMFEGYLIIYFFRYSGWIVAGMGLVLFLWCLVRRAEENWLFIVMIVSCVMIGGGIVNETLCPFLTEFLASKPDARYRAEVQRLDDKHTIDDLISSEEFNSTSTEHIMRAAHNQWFLNQYINAGDQIPSTVQFRLQPHSVQGVTYPTQTTDVVVTRYVLAEHSEMTVKLMLWMFILLVSVYLVETPMSGRDFEMIVNRSALGGLLLIFSISLSVFLSATNRIVFVGQDFPFISVQSRVAVLYPLLLMLIAVLRTRIVRDNKRRISSNESNIGEDIFLIAMLSCFTFLSMKVIEPKGIHQNESQFNVSTLVAKVSEKTKIIDEQFVEFQMANLNDSLKKMPVADVWNEFRQSEYASVINVQTVESDPFFASLLRYFNETQTNKSDPNEFLHLRRRNGICHLTVNKQHFFIPAIIGDSLHWKGNLLATKVKDTYILNDAMTNDSIKFDGEIDYNLNILPISVRSVIPSVNLYNFGKEWTPTHKPLFLLGSKRSASVSQYFCISSDTMDFIGAGKNEQIAIALSWGDKFVLYKKEGNEKKAIFSRELREKNDNYLAYNIYLNGKRQMFYPLGRESMWSYHLANLMNNAYGKNKQYRDSTIRLSIDYDLHKKFYELISDEVRIKSKPVLSENLRKKISAFRYAKIQDQCNPNLHCVYYNKNNNCLKISEPNTTIPGLIQTVDDVNELLKKYKDTENPLSNALDDLLEEKYDFSAVVIDGDGKIRLLFDYSRKRNIDPNNVFHMNKLISELYSDGMVADERDIFGNKALQYIPMGPASSFKPIAYTAITSQDNIGWEMINVKTVGQNSALSENQENDNNSDVKKYSYYGGVNVLDVEKADLSIDGGSGLTSNTYLVRSDNLYHSVMIMLGMQRAGELGDVMIESDNSISPKLRFPTFSYNGRLVCFNKNVWFKDGLLNLPDNSIFGVGLWNNFKIQQSTVLLNESSYANYFGNSDEMTVLFDFDGINKGWSFPEISTQNTEQRKIAPQIRNGFNQVLLGADPLKVTPLQMAMNAYRLVTLNSADDIFSLLDRPMQNEYKFFDIGDTWNGNDKYVQFMANQVWSQLAKVPRYPVGTARLLSGYAQSLETQGFYLYCKTGTLNDDTKKNPKDDRIKNLMVIITNKRLENIQSVSELKSVKFYVMYISYIGVSKENFSTIDFQKYIEATVNSDVFKSYMK